MLRRRWPIIAFVIWTLYVWVSRIVNAWTSADESTEAKIFSTVIAAGLILAAVVGAGLLVAARRRPFSSGESRFFTGFAVATFVVWLPRAAQILFDERREVPFKVVHVALAIISMVLAGLTVLVLRREPADLTDRPDRADLADMPV